MKFSMPLGCVMTMAWLTMAAACSPIPPKFAEQSRAVVPGDEAKRIRIYRMNRKGQMIRQALITRAAISGCIDLLKKRQVHRFAQVGYQRCQLFSEEQCQASSSISAMWGGKKYRNGNFDVTEPQIDLLPGSRWLLAPEENVTVRSLSCQ